MHNISKAKSALRLMDTAAVAHPCALSDIERTVPYKENCYVFFLIFRGEPYIMLICPMCVNIYTNIH